MRKDSDAVAALAKRLREAKQKSSYPGEMYQIVPTELIDEAIATLEESSPTKTLKQVFGASKLRTLEVGMNRCKFCDDPTVNYVIINGDSKPLCKSCFVALTTSTDETDGKGGTGD